MKLSSKVNPSCLQTSSSQRALLITVGLNLRPLGFATGNRRIWTLGQLRFLHNSSISCVHTGRDSARALRSSGRAHPSSGRGQTRAVQRGLDPPHSYHRQVCYFICRGESRPSRNHPGGARRASVGGSGLRVALARDCRSHSAEHFCNIIEMAKQKNHWRAMT